MSDEELTALAAKAFGNTQHGFSPLTDDGDALRLAVNLGIAPIQDKKDNVCAAYWTDVRCCHVGYNSDPIAATRRAIVRAAAEIQLQREKA